MSALLRNAVMAEIEVIGTGTGRTGSTTLHEALNLLGYKTYHLKEIMVGNVNGSEHLDFWFEAYESNCSNPNTLRKLFENGKYTATAHIVHSPCLESLLFELYPNAKVVHTERTNSDLWHDSVSHSICKHTGGKNPVTKFLKLVSPLFRRFKSFSPLLVGRALFGVNEPVYNVSTEYCLDNKRRMVAHYEAHNAWVRTNVPPERLLVLTNHKGGWEPLCKFLNKPVPDVPFPHANKRESMLYFFLGGFARKAATQTPAALSVAFACVAAALVYCIFFGTKRSVTGSDNNATAKRKQE